MIQNIFLDLFEICVVNLHFHLKCLLVPSFWRIAEKIECIDWRIVDI